MSYTFFEMKYAEGSAWKREQLGFLRPMVLASAVFTSVCRTVAEAPIEQAKVMRQTGRPWEWSSLYRGVTAQTARTTAMLVAIFVPYDVRMASCLHHKGSFSKCQHLASQVALRQLSHIRSHCSCCLHSGRASQNFPFRFDCWSVCCGDGRVRLRIHSCLAS